MTKEEIYVPIIGIALIALTVYEWRYSAEMQQHIDRINRDLRLAPIPRVTSEDSRSAGPTKATLKVGNDILDTHRYAHTVKDQVLTWRITHAINKSGQPVRTAVAVWPDALKETTDYSAF